MKIVAGAALLALSVSGVSADVVNIGFTRVAPANAPVNPAAQFLCVLSDSVPGSATFRFTNNVGIASSISEIFYDYDPAAITGEALLLQNGTQFSAGGANPGNLPGGGGLTPPFVAVAMFSADAQGNPSVGIDLASDWLEMRFTLAPNRTFQDVVNDLNSGELRIGLHVRSIGTSGDSDAFVNTAQVIPLPPAVWAGLSGLALVGLTRLRSARRGR